MSLAPRTPKGERTRARIIASALTAFATLGFHEASIVRITDGAGVAMGTFYLYFEGKQELFAEVVIDLNRQIRHAMSTGMVGARDRVEAERGGFRAYFDFLAAHHEVYPIIREAWFVAPAALRLHYDRIHAGYAAALTGARDSGEVADVIDPDITAWALMGVGEMLGMRYVAWSDAESPGLSDDEFEKVYALIRNALTTSKEPA